MKRNYFVGFLAIVLFGYAVMFSSLAQDIPAASKGKIKFYVDHAAFKGRSGSKVYEEFYLMLYADQLKVTAEGNKKLGVIQVQTEIEDSFGNKVSKKEWSTEALIKKDSVNIKGMAIYDQWGEELSPGKYNVLVAVSDKNGTDRGEARFDLNVNNEFEKNFNASQIEFVSSVSDDLTNKEFVKGSNSIIPNPSRRYGILNPMLYIYYELYNIPDTENGNLLINYSIKNSEGKTVKELPPVEMKKENPNISLINGINVSGLSSGIYTLNSSVIDSPGNYQTYLSRQFEVIQMDYLNLKPLMTEEQAKTAGNYLKYIATPDQYKLYESLNLTGKAQFLIQFWQDNDPTPDTKENEYLEKIKQRYAYANEHYGWGNEAGWATDRGRVLIKYGNPDEIERHYSESETDPYEIWDYHQEKNYEFIFADMKGDGQFVLINSTKEGEASNPNWQELISK